MCHPGHCVSWCQMESADIISHLLSSTVTLSANIMIRKLIWVLTWINKTTTKLIRSRGRHPSLPPYCFLLCANYSWYQIHVLGSNTSKNSSCLTQEHLIWIEVIMGRLFPIVSKDAKNMCLISLILINSIILSDATRRVLIILLLL